MVFIASQPELFYVEHWKMKTAALALGVIVLICVSFFCGMIAEDNLHYDHEKSCQGN